MIFLVRKEVKKSIPPHCDTKDGPVVKMAQKALEEGDVKIILPYVKKEGLRKNLNKTNYAPKTKISGPIDSKSA